MYLYLYKINKLQTLEANNCINKYQVVLNNYKQKQIYRSFIIIFSSFYHNFGLTIYASTYLLNKFCY